MHNLQLSSSHFQKRSQLIIRSPFNPFGRNNRCTSNGEDSQ